jgi:PKD repeat protein
VIALSKTVKSAIFYSIIGIAIGIGLILLLVDTENLVGLFQIGASEDNDNNNNNPLADRPFRYKTYYKAILAVGEEGAYAAVAGGGKPPYTFEWKFSDGITLTGENVTRSFDSPGRYFINLTVTDGTGDKLTSTPLYTDVVQEMQPKEDVTANVTAMQHN